MHFLKLRKFNTWFITNHYKLLIKKNLALVIFKLYSSKYWKYLIIWLKKKLFILSFLCVFRCSVSTEEERNILSNLKDEFEERKMQLEDIQSTLPRSNGFVFIYHLENQIVCCLNIFIWLFFTLFKVLMLFILFFFLPFFRLYLKIILGSVNVTIVNKEDR